MKKLNIFMAAVILLLLSSGANAQLKTGGDYFAGRWNMLIKGTPGGDAKMTFILEKKDSALTGVVLDSTGNELKIDKIEMIDTTATVYFTAQGYDVNVVMERKEDDHVEGRLMGMFDVEGDRVKATIK